MHYPVLRQKAPSCHLSSKGIHTWGRYMESSAVQIPPNFKSRRCRAPGSGDLEVAEPTVAGSHPQSSLVDDPPAWVHCGQ